MIELPVYLDHNATTPVDSQVLNAMLPYFSEKYGNAASNMHVFGWVAAEAVAFARKQVADLIGATPDEIVFTSGATEAVNMALKGVYEMYHRKGNHIITVATEHHAVGDTIQYLEEKGAEVTILPVSRMGLIDPGELEKSIKKETILISVMTANNETGVLQPIAEIGRMARRHGVVFFTDATQAAGKMRLHVDEMEADLLCLSAHKMYGPKGVGALYIRRKNPRVKITPLMYGGGHENGLRSGTLNVPGIVGFGEACRLSDENWLFDAAAVSHLRTYLEQQLMDLGDVYINGITKDRLPNTSNLLFNGITASELIRSVPGLAFSTGSACSSARAEPSHVLTAMGLTRAEVQASVRFSLGKNNTMEEVQYALENISAAVKKARNYK